MKYAVKGLKSEKEALIKAMWGSTRVQRKYCIKNLAIHGTLLKFIALEYL